MTLTWLMEFLPLKSSPHPNRTISRVATATKKWAISPLWNFIMFHTSCTKNLKSYICTTLLFIIRFTFREYFCITCVWSCYHTLHWLLDIGHKETETTISHTGARVTESVVGSPTIICEAVFYIYTLIPIYIYVHMEINTHGHDIYWFFF